MEQKGTTKPMIFRIDQCCREDNNGSLQESYGELISSWPPKSYTCSFCKREFRSAQALGGHMNVHRREKAKLRQIVTPQTTYLSSFLHHHHHHPLQPQAHVLDQNPNVKTSCFDVSSAFPATKFPPLSCFSDSCSFHLLCVSKFEGFRSQKSVDCSDDQEEGRIADEPKFDDLDLELRL